MQEQNFYPAGLWRRFRAFVIDFTIIFFVTSLIFYLSRPIISNRYLDIALMATLFTTFCLYNSLLISLFGTTVGKKILCIKVETVAGGKVSIWRSLLREVILKPLSIALFNVGNLISIITHDRHTIHDKISKTRVVLTKSTANNKQQGKVRWWRYPLFVLLVFACFNIEIFSSTYAINVFFKVFQTASCGIESTEPDTISMHFLTIIEKGVQIDKVAIKNSLEEAYNYTFWLIASTATETTKTTVCIYKSPKIWEDIKHFYKVEGWALGFFHPYNKSIFFSPDFLNLSPELQKEAIYHEVSHYILDNYLLMNNYEYLWTVPMWFHEGLSQTLQGKYYTNFDYYAAYITPTHYKPWELMKDYNAIDENFTTNDYYVESYLIFNFLTKTFGEDLFKNTISKAIELNIPFKSALEQTTQKQFSELEQEWLDSLKGK